MAGSTGSSALDSATTATSASIAVRELSGHSFICSTTAVSAVLAAAGREVVGVDPSDEPGLPSDELEQLPAIATASARVAHATVARDLPTSADCPVWRENASAVVGAEHSAHRGNSALAYGLGVGTRSKGRTDSPMNDDPAPDQSISSTPKPRDRECCSTSP